MHELIDLEKKQRASVPKRQSLKKTSSDDKSSKRSSVKRQKTKSTVCSHLLILSIEYPLPFTARFDVNNIIKRGFSNINKARRGTDCQYSSRT